MVRSLFAIFFLLGVFTFIWAVAIAQDETPTPDVVLTETPAPTPVIVEPPPPDPVEEEPGDPPATTPENLLGQLFALLKDGTYIVWAAAGVLVIVGLFKIVAQAAGWTITGNTAIFIALVVQVLVWLTYSIANAAGQGAAYQEWYNRVIDFIRGLLPLAGSILAANWGYGKAKALNTPVIGYKPKAKVKPSAPSVPVASGGEGRDWTKPAL